MAGFKEQWEAAPLWQRLLIVIIFPAVVIGSIWFYVIKPDIEERDRLISQKNQLKQEIARYRGVIKPQVLERLKRQIEELKKEEEAKRGELERVVGKIPTKEEIEKIFGEINRIAIDKDLIITSIKLSQPKTQNLEVIEKEGRKVVQVVAAQQGSVPVTTMEISMSLEGKTENVYALLRSLQERGLLSYPRAVSIKPDRSRGLISANVVIDVILQQ